MPAGLSDAHSPAPKEKLVLVWQQAVQALPVSPASTCLLREFLLSFYDKHNFGDWEQLYVTIIRKTTGCNNLKQMGKCNPKPLTVHSYDTHPPRSH